MQKQKIAFDIDDDNWSFGSFREVIQDIVYEQDKYNLYLITKNINSEYVNGIVSQLGMNPNNVFQGMVDNDAILAQLDDNKIQIFLTGNIEMFTLTNSSSVDTVGIYVNNAIQDIYNINPKWFQQLEFWSNRLSKINGQTENC